MQIFTFGPKITELLVLLVLLLFPLLQAKTLIHENDVARTNSTSSLWLRRRARGPRQQGCWRRPWICRGDGDSPRAKRLCCRDRCVDAHSDVNNCGLCGVRCPFAWQCCRGVCVNTNINPFHCGNCDRKCPFLVFCFYGMCGYDQPFPPKPPKPPHPWPKPGPPKPPHPWPKPGPPKPHPPPKRRPWPRPGPPSPSTPPPPPSGRAGE